MKSLQRLALALAAAWPAATQARQGEKAACYHTVKLWFVSNTLSYDRAELSTEDAVCKSVKVSNMSSMRLLHGFSAIVSRPCMSRLTIHLRRAAAYTPC